MRFDGKIIIYTIVYTIMDNLVKDALKAVEDGTFNLWQRSHVEDVCTPAFSRAFKEALKQRNAVSKAYHYLVTFTVDPKKHPDITPELETSIYKYITDQGHRPGLCVKEMYIVKETHKNGRPHWHCSIKTTKSLKKSLFTYYQKLYGNIDFSRSKGENNQDSLNYMSKESMPTRIV